MVKASQNSSSHRLSNLICKSRGLRPNGSTHDGDGGHVGGVEGVHAGSGIGGNELESREDGEEGGGEGEVEGAFGFGESGSVLGVRVRRSF